MAGHLIIPNPILLPFLLLPPPPSSPPDHHPFTSLSEDLHKRVTHQAITQENTYLGGSSCLLVNPKIWLNILKHI